jgi:acetylcholinesterase
MLGSSRLYKMQLAPRSPIMRSALCLAILSGVIANPLKATATSSSPPTVTLTSNTGAKAIFVGRSLPQFNQDLFLGVKYADEPTRFTPAQLKTTYASKDSNSGAYDLSTAQSTTAKLSYYNATQYGHDCPAYGSDTTNLVNQGLVTLNEDCLNLNIIRPQTEDQGLLPVMIWIFGGGWTQGATADPRYVTDE